MAFTKLIKDMNIIQKLDDEPNDVGGLTAAELKAKFDEPANAVKDWINNTFIPEAEEALNDARLESLPKHAHLHAANGADPITPSMIGAVEGMVDASTTIDNPAYPTPYITSVYGMPSLPTTGHWRVIYIPYHNHVEGYGVQIAVEAVTGASMYIRISSGTTWSIWKQLATTDYALARDGSNVMTGVLNLVENDLGFALRARHANGGSTNMYSTEGVAALESQNVYETLSNRRQIQIHNSGSRASKTDALVFVDVVESVVHEYPILHTGNKPSGSYTGNGDATLRQITHGGIGVFVAVWSASSFMLLSPQGGFGQYGMTAVHLDSRECGTGGSGFFGLQTVNTALNANGVTYYYQVL